MPSTRLRLPSLPQTNNVPSLKYHFVTERPFAKLVGQQFRALCPRSNLRERSTPIPFLASHADPRFPSFPRVNKFHQYLSSPLLPERRTPMCAPNQPKPIPTWLSEFGNLGLISTRKSPQVVISATHPRVPSSGTSKRQPREITPGQPSCAGVPAKLAATKTEPPS